MSAAWADADIKRAAPSALASRRFSMSILLEPPPGSVTFGVLDLLIPIEAHRFHNAAVDHDDARFVIGIGVEVLMRAVGGNVDEIAHLPVEALGLFLPGKLHLVVAVEAHVPMEVVAVPLDDVEHLFRQVPVLAAGFARRKELL